MAKSFSETSQTFFYRCQYILINFFRILFHKTIIEIIVYVVLQSLWQQPARYHQRSGSWWSWYPDQLLICIFLFNKNDFII